MKLKRSVLTAGVTLAFLLCLGFESSVSAQGRGRGGGPPAGAGQGRPASVGVDRGLGTASSRSQGGSDKGLTNASDRSRGRVDTGLDRARMASVKADALSDEDLNRYRGLSRKLGTTPEEMRERYRSALLADPDLKYGQFVAAHVVADNLGRRNSRITSDALLAGLRKGDSIGRTLQNLGMRKDETKRVEKEAERRIKEAKARNR